MKWGARLKILSEIFKRRKKWVKVWKSELTPVNEPWPTVQWLFKVSASGGPLSYLFKDNCIPPTISFHQLSHDVTLFWINCPLAVTVQIKLKSIRNCTVGKCLNVKYFEIYTKLHHKYCLHSWRWIIFWVESLWCTQTKARSTFCLFANI